MDKGLGRFGKAKAHQETSMQRTSPLVWWAACSFATILGFSRLSYGLFVVWLIFLPELWRYASWVKTGEDMRQPLSRGLALFHGITPFASPSYLWVVGTDLEKIASADLPVMCGKNGRQDHIIAILTQIIASFWRATTIWCTFQDSLGEIHIIPRAVSCRKAVLQRPIAYSDSCTIFSQRILECTIWGRQTAKMGTSPDALVDSLPVSFRRTG